MTPSRLVRSVAGLLLIAGCAGPAAPPPVAEVAVDLNLVPGEGNPASAVLWLHPDDAARSLVVGAVAERGLFLYGQDGAVAGSLAGDFDALALSYGFDAGSGPTALLVAHDKGAAALRGFVIDADTARLREVTATPLPIGDALTGLCLYRSPATGKQYAFVATDGGSLQQWELSLREGRVAGLVVRTVPVGVGAGSCAVDDAGDAVYLADESLGIWRIAAEPERDPTRELVALTSPRGPLGEEVKGIALRRDGDALHLLVADEDAGVVHVLPLPAGNPMGTFRLAGIAEPKFESLWSGTMAAAPRDAGVVLIPDEEGGGAFRLVGWNAVAAALKLPAVAADPRVVGAPAVATVEPSVETEPVLDVGDAADDPAIWIHPRDPARSLIIGAQKRRGLEVYDLSGRLAQVLPVGRINNVDLRQRVSLGGRMRDIVAGSNRTTKTLDLFEVDPVTRRLSDVVAAPIPTGLDDPYGLCMYHSAVSGKLHVFMNDSGTGLFHQWEITAGGAGLAATLVREFTVGTQAEGCVADDETGALYIAEEDAGLWRYEAEPDAGTGRRQIDSTGDGGRLAADVEGVAIFRGESGSGYLVVSNQGADNYALYRREGDNAFIGFFSVVANDVLGIDGASETDGLDVTSTPLGSAFPHGLLVVQDGRNITPAERQNFKLVPWERVAAAAGL